MNCRICVRYYDGKGLMGHSVHNYLIDSKLGIGQNILGEAKSYGLGPRVKKNTNYNLIINIYIFVCTATYMHFFFNTLMFPILDNLIVNFFFSFE